MAASQKSPDEKKTTLKELKRSDIIEASIETFRNEGFQAASIDNIVKKAKVSKPTLYRHFKNKEYLFQKTLEELFNRINSIPSYSYKSEKPIPKQLAKIAQFEIDILLCEEFIDLNRLVISGAKTMQELSLDYHVKIIELMGVETLSKWIEQAKNDGQLDIASPFIAARQFIALLKEFAFWPRLYGTPKITNKKKFEKIIKNAVEMFLDNYSIDRQQP